METFQRIRESAEYQIFSINVNHQSSLTFQSADVLECKIILGLDYYPQLAYGLLLCNPDWNGINGLVAKDQDLCKISSVSIQKILESYSQASNSLAICFIGNKPNDDHNLQCLPSLTKRAQMMMHTQISLSPLLRFQSQIYSTCLPHGSQALHPLPSHKFPQCDPIWNTNIFTQETGIFAPCAYA